MNLYKKAPLAILLPILMTGCGGGGASLSDVPSSTPVSGGITATKPNYKKAEAPKAGDFSELGFSALAPLKDLAKDGAGALTKLYTVNPDKHGKYLDDNYDYIKIDGKKVNLHTSGSNWDEVSSAEKYPVGDGVNIFYDDTNYKPILKITDYDHTRVGIVQSEINGELRSTIFYRGKDKTTDTPVSGKAVYKGNWEFAHQLHGQDTENTEGGIGDLYSANKASFEADFGSKKLTGQLDSKSDKAEIHYTVDADINGNSFTGTGKGSYDFVRGKTDGNGKKSDSKAAVSGSFFGAAAAELAGRLVENDNAFAAVFAAQQSSQDNLQTDGDLLQAGILGFSQVGSSSSYTLDDYEKINFSGDIKKIYIDDNVLIELDDHKDGPEFQALAFGKASDGSNSAYVIQGYLTKASEVPDTGKANYAGLWSGYGEQGGVFSHEDMDARFTADWTNKSLTGKLYHPNQALDAEAAVQFTAAINGNSFSGKTDRIKLPFDTSTSTLSSKAITGEAAVSGHFYGSKANELGGTIRKDDGTFGGVFAGKQTD